MRDCDDKLDLEQLVEVLEVGGGEKGKDKENGVSGVPTQSRVSNWVWREQKQGLKFSDGQRVCDMGEEKILGVRSGGLDSCEVGEVSCSREMNELVEHVGNMEIEESVTLEQYLEVMVCHSEELLDLFLDNLVTEKQFRENCRTVLPNPEVTKLTSTVLLDFDTNSRIVNMGPDCETW